MKDSEIFNWIHNRLRNHHGENHNYDFMHRFRDAIRHANRDARQIEKLKARVAKYERSTAPEFDNRRGELEECNLWEICDVCVHRDVDINAEPCLYCVMNTANDKGE